jgi:hypothetical protein
VSGTHLPFVIFIFHLSFGRKAVAAPRSGNKITNEKWKVTNGK